MAVIYTQHMNARLTFGGQAQGSSLRMATVAPDLAVHDAPVRHGKPPKRCALLRSAPPPASQRSTAPCPLCSWVRGRTRARAHSGLCPDFSCKGILLFFLTAGGPFGVEPSVQAAGCIVTILGTLVIAFFWAYPQAVMACELALMMDSNGGGFLWVHRGWGPFLGWINGWNSVASSFVNLGECSSHGMLAGR